MTQGIWTQAPISMTFPLFIAALVYVRLKVLPKYYDEATLLALDPLIELAPDDPDAAGPDEKAQELPPVVVAEARGEDAKLIAEGP